MPQAENYSVIFDLINTFFRFLSRPVVQRQLLALIIALLAAGWLSALLYEWGVRRYVRWYWANRHRLYRKGSDRKRWSIRIRRGLWIFAGQELFPVLAGLLVAAAATLFDRSDWLSGLLWGSLWLLGLFAIYRLVVAALYIFMEEARANRYHRRLFGPLMFVLYVLIILGLLTDLRRLGEVLIFPRYNETVTLGALFWATIGFYFWFEFTYVLKDVLKRVFVSYGRIHEGTLDATLTIMRYVLIALGVYFAVNLLGFDATTVAAVTGGLSIGVGFALQDVIKNFFGGLVILFEGTVRPGDYVDVSGAPAVVQKLNIRSTIVRTADNVEIIVPNQNWLNSSVTTYTGTSSRVRIKFPLSVPTSVEIGHVFQLLTDTARKHPLTLADPGPSVSIASFNGSSVDYVLAAWIADATLMSKYASDMRLMLLRAFENGEIPLA